jgi:hypothetical protein
MIDGISIFLLIKSVNLGILSQGARQAIPIALVTSRISGGGGKTIKKPAVSGGLLIVA